MRSARFFCQSPLKASRAALLLAAAGLAVLVGLGGCDSSSGLNSSTKPNRPKGEKASYHIERPEPTEWVAQLRQGAPPSEVEIEGQPWTTSQPGRLGDPRAARGGGMISHVPDWPATLRVYGKGSNTYLNSIIGDLCYETLCSFHPVTLETIPRLATHWWISDDKMTFRFKLDPRARWSDGKPVTTRDVVATYRLIMDDTLIAPMEKQLLSKMEEPLAVSDHVLEVRCKEKHWRNFITISGLQILPAHEIEGMKGGEFLDQYNSTYTASSGPYIVHKRDIKTNESITLTRRDDYWDEEGAAGLYNFSKIRFIVVREDRLAFDKALKGELDFYPVYTARWWVEDVPKAASVRHGQMLAQKVFTKSPEGYQGLAFNLRKKPWDDRRVRQAIAHLYDRRRMLEKFAYNEYTPLESYFPNGDGENPDNEVVEYDPKEAQELLAAAGWSERGPDGILVKNGRRLVVELMYRTSGFEKYYTTFKEDCKRVGVEVNLQLITPETHWKNMMDRKFEAAGMAWGAVLFPDPRSMWSSEMADLEGSNNITGFKNERADEIIAQYDREFDLTKRNALLRELDGILFNEHPYMLDWYIPSQRILYKFKFGTPPFVISKYADWRGVFGTWWVDPEKDAALRGARKSGAKLGPIPPVQLHPWDDQPPAKDVASR